MIQFVKSTPNGLKMTWTWSKIQKMYQMHTTYTKETQNAVLRNGAKMLLYTVKTSVHVPATGLEISTGTYIKRQLSHIL